ncbi:MAG: SIS domain-containing protein [Candidatus Hodarchaeales archaeon]|jgi:glucosamine--fructose-6-phosphate aminotransferase (isomerizing)
MTESDFMLSEILEQPRILQSILNNNEVEKIASTINHEKIDRIILTGCGDSYCAAWFGAHLADKWCPQFEVQHYEPFDFVTYFDPKKLENALVIGISVSGGTLRVLEALRFARKYKATTLVLTDNPQGKIVKESDQHLLIQASPPESLLTTSYTSEAAKKYVGYQNDVAQTKTYMANLGTLSFLIALLGSKPDLYIEKVRNSFSLVKKALDNKDVYLKIGQSLAATSNNISFVGSGPNSSTCLFGAYKMFEFTLHGFACDIEEYCHTRYFITTEKSSVIFFAPDVPCYDRVMEIEPVLHEQIGSQTIIITDKSLVKNSPSRILSLALPEDSFLSPIVLTIPIEIISYALAKEKGFNTNTFRGGVETEKYVTGSFSTIRQSRLRY